MSPKTCLVHIGTPKTGSTSIQEMLTLAARDGSLGPVCYPLWRSESNHNYLQFLYLPPDKRRPWARQADFSDEFHFRRRRRLFSKFFFAELGKANDAVISSEALCDYSPDRVARFRHDLESLGFTQFHIVLYIRDPADYYLSLTQQRLKESREEPPIEDPDTFRYEFRRAAETWACAFPGRLMVRRALTKAGDNVTEDFCSLLWKHLGVSLPQLKERMNISLSAEAMQILQEYRHKFRSDNDGLPTPNTERLRRFLEASQTDIPQSRPVLKQEIALRIRANHAADAEVIFDRYGIDLDLRNPTPSRPLRSGTTYRIDSIVDSVDPDVVQQLRLRLAWTELTRPRRWLALPLDMALFLYRFIAPEHRPERLDRWLRKFLDFSGFQTRTR